MSVRVRGSVYSSIRAAAVALGLHPYTIWLAIEEGREDTVGLSCNAALRKPCVINGRRYSSRTAAALDLGVSKAAISQAIKAGRGIVRSKAAEAEQAGQEAAA